MSHADSKGRGPASALPALVLAACFSLAALSGQARAEKADRDKPVNIESDRMNADDTRKEAVFLGNVVLTQGTLVIRAERLTVRQDAQGFQQGVAFGSAAAPATFRQKRDGVDEFVDAEAERIEYDGRSEKVQLFNRARLRRDGGDDVRGNYISYDARTELFSVQSAQDGATPGRDSRVRAVIMPRKDGTTPAAKPPLDLKPAPGLAAPRAD